MRMWCCFGPASHGGGTKAGSQCLLQAGLAASAHTQLQITSVTTINVTSLSTFAWLSSCLSGPTLSGREKEGGKVATGVCPSPLVQNSHSRASSRLAALSSR